jgi:hypothetical protein
MYRFFRFSTIASSDILGRRTMSSTPESLTLCDCQWYTCNKRGINTNGSLKIIHSRPMLNKFHHILAEYLKKSKFGLIFGKVKIWVNIEKAFMDQYI